MADNRLPFLGNGWSFPPIFSNQGGKVDMVSGQSNVHKSIQIILSTNLGERVYHEDFGAGLEPVRFEPVTSALINTIEQTIARAILNHEPRVTLDGVEVAQDANIDSLLMIQIQYTIQATNSRFNMVYPFYLDEN